jgi:hypothetical protein
MVEALSRSHFTSYYLQLLIAHLQDLTGLSLEPICLADTKASFFGNRHSGIKVWGTLELLLKTLVRLDRLKER